MPIDRSPVSTPAARMASSEPSNQQSASQRNLNFINYNPQQPGESSEINSNEFKLLKLSTFWHKQPKLWFTQLESEFLVFRVRSDDIKCNTVIRHLDE